MEVMDMFMKLICGCVFISKPIKLHILTMYSLWYVKKSLPMRRVKKVSAKIKSVIAVFLSLSPGHLIQRFSNFSAHTSSALLKSK